MKKHINTFDKGLNRDYSKNKFPNNAYYNAEGLRLITNDGLSSFALRNIEGNSLSGSLDSGWVIHGPQAYCVLRDKLIILAIGSTPGTNDRIYSFTIGTDGELSAATILYTGNLEFSLTYPIKKIISRYESPDLQKIYWTQGDIGVKFCNIVNPGLSSYVSTQFDIIPAFDIVPITVSSLGTGSLKSGMVHYTYQLYNLYGAETCMLPPSELIPLGPSASTGIDALFVGGKENSNAGKSVTLTLTGLDTNFNRIKLIRVHHTSLLADPTITIIEDTVLAANMTFTDNGTQNLGSYTLEEFNTLKYDFYCQDLETKNNLLFAANVTENIWDVTYDARAYRFNTNAYADIYNEDGITGNIRFTLTQLTQGTVVIPETHDCFNIYNDLSIGTEYKYKGDGGTIGGQGINVSYSFSTGSTALDTSTNSILTETNNASNSITNSIHISEEVSFMRDEIYSFGIILYNTKGQRSYVKWVGDIRFPSVFDKALVYNTSVSGTAINLYINFTISNLNLIADCVSYQIVRCERKAEDRTILAQGLIGATRTYTGDTTSWTCPAISLPTIAAYKAGSGAVARNQTLNKRLLEFISPEISYGNNIEYTSGDILELEETLQFAGQYFKMTNLVASFTSSSNFSYNYSGLPLPMPDNALDVSIVINKLQNLPAFVRRRKRYVLAAFKKSDYNTLAPLDNNITPGNQLAVSTYTFEKWIRKFGHRNIQGFEGTLGLAAISTDLDFTTDMLFEYPEELIASTYPYGRLYTTANYKRNIKPYGGASYEVRTRREYIPCSDIIPKVTTTVIVTKGDTYISYFEFQRAFVAGLVGQSDITENFVEVYKFPVETSINTRWQNNKTFTQFYSDSSNNTINNNAIIIQEKAGTYSKNKGGVLANFTQEDNLYSYNSVYSKQNNSIKFYPKPLDFTTNKVFDCRVIYSDRKFNNETIDSWTNYKPLNFKDVDSQYGPINAITNYNTDLLYFQDNGWGVLSVEERELLQGSNSAQLTTGTGGILSRYDYVSTNGGCKHPNSIFKGRYSMYFYDDMNKSLFSFIRNGGDNNISKMLGVQSFLNKNIVEGYLTDVVAGYNPKYNEVNFTFSGSTWLDGNYKTIVFNELIKSFTRIDQINPTIYINTPDWGFATTNGLNIYSNNSGNYGQFFGTYYPSKVSILINPDGVLVNRFDFIQWLTECGTVGNEKTFDTIRFYNDWQDSGDITLTPDSNVFHVFRTWRFNQFLDSLEQRVKDAYMVVELKFTNSASNDKLVVHDLITTYSPTAPW